MIVICDARSVYTEVIEKLFAVASIFASYYTHVVERLHCARHHIAQIANGRGNDIQRTGLI